MRSHLLGRLLREARRPQPFEPGTHAMWTSRYTSREALAAHFDPTTDDASRRPETIGASADWIRRRVSDAPARRLLDLGCGPGLYAERFGRAGLEVIGLDISRASIGAARRNARHAGLAIEYRRADYLRAPFPAACGVATLIYGGFCVISDDERDRLLGRVKSSLSPGGYFVFDVFTERYTRQERNSAEWYVKSGAGFWHGGAHLVLQDAIDYHDGVLLNRYIVVPSIGRIRRFHLWYRPYTGDTIRETLERAGFQEVELYADLTGSAYDAEGSWIGVVARRPGRDA